MALAECNLTSSEFRPMVLNILNDSPLSHRSFSLLFDSVWNFVTSDSKFCSTLVIGSVFSIFHLNDSHGDHMPHHYP